MTSHGGRARVGGRVVAGLLRGQEPAKAGREALGGDDVERGSWR